MHLRHRSMLYHLIQLNPNKDITLHVSANNPAMVRCDASGSWGSHIHLFNCNSSYTTVSDSRLKNSWLAFMRTILILNHARQRMLFGFGYVAELHFGVGIYGVCRANTSYRRDYCFFVCTIRKPERSSVRRKKGPASPFSGLLCGRRVLLRPNPWRNSSCHHCVLASATSRFNQRRTASSVDCELPLQAIRNSKSPSFQAPLAKMAIMVQQFPGNGAFGGLVEKHGGLTVE